MAYKLPGTTIEEINTSVAPSSGSTQRTPVFIGLASSYIYVEYEAVIRSSTGLTDSLAHTTDTIYSVTAVGSQRGLKNYIAGTHYNLVADQIIWTSTGIVTAGATYYVSYNYNRPVADYKYKEFSSYGLLTADLGACIPANPLVMIGQLALQLYGLPKIGVVQIASDSEINYINALELIKERDIQTVGILKSTPGITVAGTTHVVERSLPDNGKFRMFFTGAPAGTALGSVSDPASICGMAYSVQQERTVFVNAPRALYYYIDPVTKAQLSTTVDGAFIGAAAGAYHDSFLDPTTTLINKTIPGIYLIADDFDGYYTDTQLKKAGAASCYVLTNSNTLALTLDDLTTDNASAERNNINIISAKDYIARDIIAQMNRNFRGALIKDRTLFKNVVYTYLNRAMQQYRGQGYIESIGTITVDLPADAKNTVLFYYSLGAVYSAKTFTGTYSIITNG